MAKSIRLKKERLLKQVNLKLLAIVEKNVMNDLTIVIDSVFLTNIGIWVLIHKG